jgi:tetratricopeptide (TPR) repeat protein
MKLKITKIFSGAFLIWLLMAACNLEVVNLASLSPQVALADSVGVKSLIFSAYERTNDFLYYGQEQMIEPEIMADNLVIVNNTGRFVQESVNGVAAHMDRWGQEVANVTLPNGRYVAINECNTVLANVDALKDGTTQAQKERLKGEALFLRSLNYFDLLRTYSYEPGKEVNGFKLGVVLRIKPTAGASDAVYLPRSTNDEGYAQLEADLKQAILFLPNPAAVSNTVTNFPYRATKQAAYALLAKVYLYWGKYSDAATQADLALSFTNAPLTTTANYAASWSATPHPESIFESQIAATDWNSVDGVNNSLHSMTMNIISGSQYVVGGSDELIAAHEAGDIRRTLYDNIPGGFGIGTQSRFRSRKWSGSTGSYLENIPIIRRADVLLIAAEGKARSGNETGARTDLNLLRTNRGLAATALSGQALLDLILNERRVELALEGNRWYDLKRLGLNITKAAGNNASTVPYTDFRILSRIPVDQVVQSGGKIVQNPGY